MSLVFTGDIAYPYENAINIEPLKEFLQGKNVIINLEGPILYKVDINEAYNKYNYNLYSSPSVINVLKALHVRSVSLANNHMCDFKTTLHDTIQALQNNQIDFFGTQEKKWSFLNIDDVDYALYGTYTFISGGNRGKFCSLNDFDAKQVLSDVKKCRLSYPDKFIVVFIHWGYELADYPQPADREWAREVINIGANAVIGHHPHVIQGIEFYKHGFIAYSLGNFILPQVKYLDKSLKYNSTRVLEELIIEVSPRRKGEELVRPHFFYYDLQERTVKKLELDEVQARQKIADLTPFNGLSDKDYQAWYKGEIKKNLYPTYNSYHAFLKTNYNNLHIRGLKTIRNLLIRTGIHNPYK